MKRHTTAAGLALALVVGVSLVAGCTLPQTPDANRQAAAADLADTLRAVALKLPDQASRDQLVTGLITIRNMLSTPDEPEGAEPKLPMPPGAAAPAPAWATMFAPTSLAIGFFTRSRDFDGQPGDDGLEVRIQALDQFGDPTKAVGSYRIEVFSYRTLTTEKRGDRLGHWYVPVLDVESNRKFYDPVDRSYVFPLLWEKPIPAGTTVIVQATFYPPEGFKQKLFAQRVIKVGGDEAPKAPPAPKMTPVPEPAAP